ncbi:MULTISPECIES: type III secretion system inner membrane ring subunit SctD [Yersinia]|uniref:EscD/YscD/HrpQ family type III secretion system inner membrane ring protein n=1 Tax=Yersinia massiliensis TaxID=419257 RepID=A0ABM6UZP9_9GAMM|nr:MULTISPECIES: type III secretion system inner membrane ring subunit SctD [Yersinia]HEC1649084.1 type III secretion system inner membrane ring subunit SctD [Yersinia enterocolitica]AVX39947.1 EscD/YscD/HrpQ family type III secretion system inner membrane ring protein [Yersinia massiliensis]QKJ10674.1 type III secretion system inner membrane ring subunit SctD [Yersinia massiliensis]CFR28109.1 type-III secretion protein [Yersinia frederiksenii]CNL01410.1 type-III secretion protein [Yersinia fr
MPVRFKLRLLNGEYRGRELMLPIGEFTLGEKGCDVLLPLLREEILTLIITEQQIVVQTSDEVWVNGSLHNLQHPLPLRKCIEIAGVVLTLGEENDVLSRVKITPKAETHLLLWLSLLTVVILTLLFTFIFWVIQQPKSLQSYLPPDIPTQLTQQLKKPALQGVKGRWLSDGSVVLIGHCTSSPAVINLQNFLSSNHVVFSNQLMCDDHILTSVSDVLHQYGYQNIEVQIGEEPGNIILQGAIKMDDQWLKVQTAFAGIIGLKSWKVVNTQDGQISQLIEHLRGLELLGYLSMSLSNKEIIISGELSPIQQQRMMKMLETLAVQQPEYLTVKYQNIPIADQTTQLLPATIVSYGGNRHLSFVQLANGVRLQEGTVLANGYKVIFIGMQGISLFKANNLIHIPMNF